MSQHVDKQRIQIYESNENQNPLSVEIIKLIKVQVKKGSGIDSDPVRLVDVYYDLKGNYVFTVDSLSEDY
ncbi:hypothetical protein AB4Y30_11565 [Ornithinibacillus sp. 4-3]|uniref:Uncharacterized protein n=1 Tax=Ornithinibacillus sp. 4-3 TaxID=3231488 RepID=A0AB39HN06_9BACI